MAPEVIDLITSSEDEGLSATIAAKAAIQAFRPRQRKDRPVGEAAQHRVTTGLRKLQHAVSKNAVSTAQPRPPARHPPLQVPGSALPFGGREAPETATPDPKSQNDQSSAAVLQQRAMGKRPLANDVQHQQPTPVALVNGARIAKRTKGRQQLEIQRRLRDFLIRGCASVKKSVDEEDQEAPLSRVQVNNTTMRPIQTADAQTREQSHVGNITPKAKSPSRPATSAAPASTATNHGLLYTSEEDALLKRLKEAEGLSWHAIQKHFRGRTLGSLQVRYSTTKKRANRGFDAALSEAYEAEHMMSSAPPRRAKRARITGEYVPWTEASAVLDEEFHSRTNTSLNGQLRGPNQAETVVATQTATQHTSITRSLRHRELGSSTRCRRSCVHHNNVSDELHALALDDLGPHKSYNGTSGDVTCVAWGSDGNRFAAGSIAISDEQSMQYNRPRNLLLGDVERNTLKELPEHHVHRGARQETQDPRLFTTVAAIAFTKDGRRLITAGGDRKSRVYDTDSAKCLFAIEQPASVDLVSISEHAIDDCDFLATGSRTSETDSVSVYRLQEEAAHQVLALAPARHFPQTSAVPSALKWGPAQQHKHLLLAGFASDLLDDRDEAGETLLWDVAAEKSIELSSVTRSVFDVAWNPSPSSSSSSFAVASSKRARGVRSVVQCFAPKQDRASRVLEWDCPAFDINDVVYCPHDENVIAAGATDGNVYVWDKRAAKRLSSPLHVLRHGATLNILDHDCDRELVDTGVRFLSWSSTGSRLYSGSSDGAVKVWDIYRAMENAHVKDVTTFDSAIMSGSFSPDCRDLLIGEDHGQLNLLSVGHEGRSIRAAKRFDLLSGTPPPVNKSPMEAARDLRSSGEIDIKPMGALPKLQVVQGAKYRGPFLHPSTEEFQKAQKTLEAALEAQNERDLRAASSQDCDLTQELQELERRVVECQDAVLRLESRRDDAIELAPMAATLQENFRVAAIEQTQREAALQQSMEQCKLDCNYLPPAGDETAPDSRRSEQRVPGRLREMRPILDTNNLTRSELEEAGLISRCSTCSGPAASAAKGVPHCEKCALARAGLTASCMSCSSPMRPVTDGTAGTGLCEQCDFACFRCGHAATFDPRASTVSCPSCVLVWRADVLGYRSLHRIND